MTQVFSMDLKAWKSAQLDIVTPAVKFVIDLARGATRGAGPDAGILSAIEHELALERPADGRGVSEPIDAPTWLGDVYSRVLRGEFDEAIDILFGRVDDLLSHGEFERCDRLLQTIDLRRLDTNLIVAVLSITLSSKSHLPYRTRLFDRARHELENRAPERAERLLNGLA